MALLGIYISYIILATIGATFGLHRYWSHKQGKRRVWFEWLSLFCALPLGVYKPLGWIGIHRLHHKYSDTILDPHCPDHKGLKVLFSDFSDSNLEESLSAYKRLQGVYNRLESIFKSGDQSPNELLNAINL